MSNITIEILNFNKPIFTCNYFRRDTENQVHSEITEFCKFVEINLLNILNMWVSVSKIIVIHQSETLVLLIVIIKKGLKELMTNL